VNSGPFHEANAFNVHLNYRANVDDLSRVHCGLNAEDVDCESDAVPILQSMLVVV